MTTYIYAIHTLCTTAIKYGNNNLSKYLSNQKRDIPILCLNHRNESRPIYTILLR